MKTNKLKFFMTIVWTISFASVYSQGNWRLNGNTGALPNAATSPNFNLLGTAAGNNTPINFITNGTQKMSLTTTGGPLGDGQLLMQNDISLPTDNNAQILMGGAIKFDQIINDGPGLENVLWYGYTPISGNPSPYPSDGFRCKWQNVAEPNAIAADCLIFEKTDSGTPDPDGCIQFTNTGNN